MIALNDLVVKSGSNGRLARFSISVDDEPVADYHVTVLFLLHRQARQPIILLLAVPSLIQMHRCFL